MSEWSIEHTWTRVRVSRRWNALSNVHNPGTSSACEGLSSRCRPPELQIMSVASRQLTYPTAAEPSRPLAAVSISPRFPTICSSPSPGGMMILSMKPRRAGRAASCSSARSSAAALENDHAVCVRKPPCAPGFRGSFITVLSQSICSLEGKRSTNTPSSRYGKKVGRHGISVTDARTGFEISEELVFESVLCGGARPLRGAPRSVRSRADRRRVPRASPCRAPAAFESAGTVA